MILSKVEDIVATFEATQKCEGAVDIRPFVQELTGPERSEAVVELVRSDIEYRRETGLPIVPLDTYRQTFPEVFDDPQRFSDVAFEEYRQRRRRGEECFPDEYAQRWNIPVEHWSEIAAGASESVASLGPGETSCLDGYPIVRQFFPGFQPLWELGSGAAGRVFLAKQGEPAERLVVVKLTQQPNAEPKQLARLQHTNIVPIYSVHRHGSWQLVCMPFLGHVTLADLLRWQTKATGQAATTSDSRDAGQALLSTVAEAVGKTIEDRNRSLSWVSRDRKLLDLMPISPSPSRIAERDAVDTTVWLASRIAAGLAHAHQRGIVHSDLKPSNILWGYDGEPRILDFHLAHHSAKDSLTWVGGTLDYLSPEHLQRLDDGEPPDAGCDQFSFGVLVYQLLTGKLPFQNAKSSSPEGLAELRAARGRLPDPPSRIQSGISPDIDAIVLKCLAPAVSDRFRSLADVATDLQRHLDDLPPRYVRSWAPREHIRKWLRRNRWVRSTGFVSVASLLLFVVVAVAFGTRVRQFRQAEARAQLAAWQLDFGEAEAHLASAGFAGGDVLRPIEATRQWMEEFGFDGKDVPAWVHLLSMSQQQQLFADASRLEMWMARNALAASWAATDEKAAALRSDAQTYQKSAVGYWPSAQQPLVLQWQSERLKSAAPSSTHSDAEIFQSWLRTRPHDALSYPAHWPEQRLMAFEAFATGDDAATIAMLEDGLPRHTGDLAAWIVLGHALARQRQFDRAEASYLVAHTLRPDAAVPLIYRGLVRLDAGRFDLASADLQRALEIEPQNPLLYANRALCRQAQGKLSEALADCDRAIELGIRQTRMYFVRARIHQALGDSTAAERDRKEGLSRRPEDELSWLARGFAKAADDPSGAVADFAAALQLNPRSASALESSAAVYFDKLQNPSAALDCMTRLVQAQPQVPRHYANRGVLHARLGAVADAERDAQDALRRGQDADTLYRVAGVYAQLASKDGSFAGKALDLLRKAAFANPALLWKRLAVGDPDLQPLAQQPSFQELQQALEKLSK